jgi:very-short-patch-repair endonuclease
MDRHGLRILAERQHGALRLEQARHFGLDDATVARMVERGEAEPIGELVLRLRGAPRTREQRAMVAVLDAGQGAVISHDSAAALWAIPGFAPEPWQVLRPRRKKDPQPYLATIHETRRLPAHHVVRLDGIPLTSPVRTIFDLANLGRIHPGRIERALDTAMAKGLVGPRALQAMLHDLGGRGRRGTTLLRSLAEARGPGDLPPESGLEHRVQAILAKAGITGFERQVVVGDEVEPIGRVDFAHLTAGVVLEVDSSRFHDALLDQEADKRRDARITAGGWRIVRVTEFEVWHRPDIVVFKVLEALRRAA